MGYSLQEVEEELEGQIMDLERDITIVTSSISRRSLKYSISEKEEQLQVVRKRIRDEK